MIVLVWCSLIQAENEPKMTNVSDPRLSLSENDRFQKPSYSAFFQAKNDLYINSGTDLPAFCSTVIPALLHQWCDKHLYIRKLLMTGSDDL
jgi:hypothetical protein